MPPLLHLLPCQKQARPRHEDSISGSLARHKKWWSGIRTTAFVDNNTNFRMLNGDNLERDPETYNFQTSITANKAEHDEAELSAKGIQVERTIAWT